MVDRRIPEDREASVGSPDLPRLHRLASRPKWVTWAATPLLLGAFFQQPLGMALDLAGFGTLAAAMWMTRQGLDAEAAFDVQTAASPPAIPRKLFGGLMAGLGLGLAAAAPGAVDAGVIVGLSGLALHLLAFGIDPMRAKGMAGGGDFQQDRAQRMIEEGESHLARMRDAIALTGDPALQRRVGAFADTVRALFDQVRDRPGELGATRRYMGIYLIGACEATQRFAALYRRQPDPRSRDDYLTLLDDLEHQFRARSQALLADDRADLEIEIAVLRDRLQREGVPTAAPAPRALTSDDALSLDRTLARWRDKSPTGH